MAEILKTSKYDYFRIMDENRELNRNHIKKLVKSIEENNKLYANPILVDEHLHVIDGQHRLEAAKVLGVPIYYRMVEGIDSQDMLTFNTTNLKWSTEDVLKFYCSKGLPDYLYLHDLQKTVGLPFSVIFSLCLGNSHCNYKQFREGKFKFSKDLIDIPFVYYKETLAILRTLKVNIGSFRSKKFARAFFNFAKREDFEVDRWYRNLTMLINRFHPCPTEKEYEDLIEKTYYYRKKRVEDN